MSRTAEPFDVYQTSDCFPVDYPPAAINLVSVPNVVTLDTYFGVSSDEGPSLKPPLAPAAPAAMKLVYEHDDVILDTIRRTWGLQPLAIVETASMVRNHCSSMLL